MKSNTLALSIGFLTIGMALPAMTACGDEGTPPGRNNGGTSSTGSGGTTGTGTGGTTGTGTGGTTPGTGGTTPGTGGTTTGTGGTGGQPIGVPIPISAGAGEASSVGIAMVFFTASDASPPDGMGDSVITPPCGEDGPCYETSSTICANGTASLVPAPATDAEYSSHWGAMIGASFCTVGETEWTCDPAADYDPAANGVTGFGFTLGGDANMGAQGRFVVTQGDTDYCTEVGVNTSFRFTDLVSMCWGTAGSPFPGGAIQQIKWQVVTNATAATEFNFCVDNLTALTD